MLGKMVKEPTAKNTSLEALRLLDPAMVVRQRSWTQPTLEEETSAASSASPWVFQPDPVPTKGWLQGLVQEESAPSLWTTELNGKGQAQAPASGWLDGLIKDEPAQEARSNASASWLVGLVKAENRPAIADLRRMLLGDSDSAPLPTAQPSPPDETDPFASIAVSLDSTEVTAPQKQEVSDPWPTAPTPAFTQSETTDTSWPEPTPSATEKQEPQAKAVSNDNPWPTEPTQATPSPVEQPKLRLTVRPVEPAPQTVIVKAPEPKPVIEPEPSVAIKQESVPEAPALPRLETRAELISKPKPAPKPKAPQATAQFKPLTTRAVSGREKASFYHSLATMFEAGVPLFAIFEFIAREGTTPRVSEICRRIAQKLASGQPLPLAAAEEPALFDRKAVRMLDAGYRGGDLSGILERLAHDEESSWKLYQSLKGQLTYPFFIALITLAAVFLLPPFVLTGLLEQVVALTDRPPALTQWLLNFSALLASPWTISLIFMSVVSAVFALRTHRGRELIKNSEVIMWFVPVVGPMWRSVVGLRFLKIFSMTYQSGIPSTIGLELSASACGSELVHRVYPVMKRTLLDGGSLTESLAAGGFLPQLALEAVNAGELSGSIPTLLDRTADVLAAEVDSRIDAVAKLVEPIVLAILGVVVGVFVLGCLLPIVELSSTL